MTGRAPGHDDGSADPELRAVLDGYDGSARTRGAVLQQAVGSRWFVPVTATATREHVDEGTGLRAESSAQMALVSLVSESGERAVPAFADVPSLTRWRDGVRPVPVGLAYLCRSALDDGAVAVVLDPLGAKVALDASELASLSAGYVPVPGSALSFRRTTEQLREPESPPDPALVAALVAALRPERLTGARLLQGPTGSGLVLGVVPREDLGPAALVAMASRVITRLGAALPAEGLDLAVVPPTGPGWPLPARRGLLGRRRHR